MITKTRYNLIDTLRGLAIIAMVVYHGLWDLVNMYAVEIPWFGSQSAFVFQRSIRWAFLLLAGFSVQLGRKPLKRGLITLGCSVVISLVSMVVIPDTPIMFGVLTMIGLATMLTGLLNPYMKKLNPYIGLSLCVVLFLLTARIPQGFAGPFMLPRWLYANDLTALLGFPYTGFNSSDYVPLIPWLFSYWMGYYIFGIFRKHKWLDALCVLRLRPLEFLGRHSLLIYMAHQPLLYGVFYVLFCVLKR